MNPTPQTVLIFRTGQLGDTLVALPAIRAIRARHPGSRMLLLTDRHPGRGFVTSWDVLCETGWIDEVESYRPGVGFLGKWANTLQLLKRLRTRHLTDVYLLTAGRGAWQKWRDRFFFRIWLGARYCHEPEATPTTTRNADGTLATMVPEWRRLLAAIPVDDPVEFVMPVSPTAQREAKLALDARGLPADAWILGVAPGSKMRSKIWPVAHYVELGNRLLEKHGGLRLVILGGAEDVEAGDRLCAAWGARGINLAGAVSVMAAAAALKQCVAYVGNDTGTMHLAAMVGIPCVAIFSARDNPGRWEPYGNRHTVIRSDVDCAGCMLEVCGKYDNKCLRMITVDEVFAAVSRTIAAAGAGTAGKQGTRE